MSFRSVTRPSRSARSRCSTLRNRILVLDRKSRSAHFIERPSNGDVASFDVAARQVEGLRRATLNEPVRGPPPHREYRGRGLPSAAAGAGHRRVGRPAHRVPLRVELNAGASDVEGAVSLFDIHVNPRLDESLFRLEPPDGYALTTEQRPATSDEEAVANMLRTYAEHAGGRFPPRLDDWAGYAKALPEDKFERHQPQSRRVGSGHRPGRRAHSRVQG